MAFKGQKGKMNKPFWSNCLIQAIKHYLREPKNVDFIYIAGPRGIHVMWLNKRTRKISHFTDHKVMGYRRLSNLWFKGTIEVVEYDALKKWCELNNVKFKVERP